MRFKMIFKRGVNRLFGVGAAIGRPTKHVPHVFKIQELICLPAQFVCNH